MIKNKILQDQVNKAADQLGIPREVATLAYKLYWQFNKSVIEDLPISNINNEEELAQYRHSINLPGLGKLYTDWDRINGQRKRIEVLKNKAWKK